MRRTRNTISLFAFAAVFFAAPVHSQSLDPAPTKEQPILQINLHKFGYDSKNARNLQNPVQFTDSDRIAIGWVSAEESTSGQKPVPPNGQPRQLHLLFLDSQTGKKLHAAAWPTPVTFNQFHRIVRRNISHLHGKRGTTFFAGFETDSSATTAGD